MKTIILLCIITVVSCSFLKDDDSIVIYYAKSKCFGKCAVFKLTVFQNGNGIYEGIKNVSNVGKYSFSLDDGEFEDLKKIFIENNFNDLANNYLDDYKRDLQKYTIQLSIKTIVFHKMKAPANLSLISNFLDEKINKLSLVIINTSDVL